MKKGDVGINCTTSSRLQDILDQVVPYLQHMLGSYINRVLKYDWSLAGVALTQALYSRDERTMIKAEDTDLVARVNLKGTRGSDIETACVKAVRGWVGGKHTGDLAKSLYRVGIGVVIDSGGSTLYAIVKKSCQ